MQVSPLATTPVREPEGETLLSGYVCRGLSGIFSDGGSTPPASTIRLDEKPLRRFHRVEWCRPAHDTISMPWFVYILRCSDLSYYVGHTENPQQRVITHNAGRGPVYTSRRRPVELAYEEMPSKAAAVKRERQMKKWSRSKKQALIAGNSATLKGLSRRRKKKPSSI